jgi:hypothetical protein
MSDDTREAQSKHDRPAAGSGMGPVAPEPTQVKLARPAPPAISAPPAAASTSAVPNLPAVPRVPFVPAGSPLSVAPPRPGVLAGDDADYPDEDDYPPTFSERLRRLRPAPVILTVGSLGSLFFLLRAVTSHTTPVAVLMSAGVVTGLIFGVDSAIASIATYRATQVGNTARAVVLAVVGGIAGVFCAAALSGVLVMILVLNS